MTKAGSDLRSPASARSSLVDGLFDAAVAAGDSEGTQEPRCPAGGAQVILARLPITLEI